MRQPVLDPNRFAEWFNEKVPGAYRKLTTQDAQDLAEVGLIGKYGYYGRSDIETARAVLQYEQLREQRSQQENKVRTCKRCGQPLPAECGRGRPREYCDGCESTRSRERWRKWHEKQKIHTAI